MPYYIPKGFPPTGCNLIGHRDRSFGIFQVNERASPTKGQGPEAQLLNKSIYQENGYKLNTLLRRKASLTEGFWVGNQCGSGLACANRLREASEIAILFLRARATTSQAC